MAVQAWALDMAWTQDSPLSFISCVTLDKLLLKSHFLFIYKMTVVLIPISEGYYKDWINIYKAIKIVSGIE